MWNRLIALLAATFVALGASSAAHATDKADGGKLKECLVTFGNDEGAACNGHELAKATPSMPGTLRTRLRSRS